MSDQVVLPKVVAGAMRWGEWGAKLSTLELQRVVEGCLEAGITAFDHADIYGHYTEEAAFGRVLAKAPNLRDDLLLVTKCGIKLTTPNRPSYRLKSYDSSKKHIVESAENSLKALHTDRIDLLLIHRPDYLMDADEIAEAFSLLEKAGKVRSFGVSNFTPRQVELLHSRWPGLITNQLELSLKHVEPLTDGSLDQAQQLRLPPMIWSPLGGGDLLTGDSPLSLKLAEMARRHNTSADVIAYAWVLMHPSKPSVVTGSTKLERIIKANEALQLHLSREEWYELLEVARGHEIA